MLKEIVYSMCEEEIIDLITEFSDRYLDDEFKKLNIKLARRLSDKVSFSDDSPEIWAGAIIFAVCQLNFVFDGAYKIRLGRVEVAYYFSTTQNKLTLKARDIRRLLKLKLGDEEFSSEFVLSLNVPESDNDLKRIRQLGEIKRQILPRRTLDDVDFLKNRELQRLLDRISREGESEENLNELYRILRPSFLIQFKSGFSPVQVDDGDKFRFLFFTRMEKCPLMLTKDDDLKPDLFAFYNVIYYLENPDFEGIVINEGSDDYFVSKDMLRRVYPDPERVDYYHVFFYR